MINTMIDYKKIPFCPFILFSLLPLWAPLLAAGVASHYVEDACSVTTYQVLCVRSLGSFSDEARRSPRKWARAGVSVTIGDVKALSRYVRDVRKFGGWRGRSHAAISDCAEVVQDALDNLHESLDELRRLNRGEFGGDMNDVLTWLSAAMTDLDTCRDSLEEGKGGGGRGMKAVERKVQHALYMTSNALALANKLATTGLRELQTLN